MSSKGRTELKISLSRAKNVKEAAGDVHFCVFPQKTSKNAKKLVFSSKFSEIFRTCPNASGRIRMHPNASECIRAHPNRSQQVRASPKTSKNLRKHRKTCENFAKILKKNRDRLYPVNLALGSSGMIFWFHEPNHANRSESLAWRHNEDGHHSATSVLPSC